MTTTNVTMQQRRDTSANWKTNNPVINSGEICFETDTGKMKIGNGKDNYLSLPYKANDDIYKMTDKLYDGVDLSVKFADEIKNYYLYNTIETVDYMNLLTNMMNYGVVLYKMYFKSNIVLKDNKIIEFPAHKTCSSKFGKFLI